MSVNLVVQFVQGALQLADVPHILAPQSLGRPPPHAGRSTAILVEFLQLCRRDPARHGRVRGHGERTLGEELRVGCIPGELLLAAGLSAGAVGRGATSIVVCKWSVYVKL